MKTQPNIAQKVLGRVFCRPYYKAMHSPTGLDEFFYLLSFDVEFKKDVKILPELVKVLHKYDIKANFAAIGKFVEIYPSEHRLLVHPDFEILSHSYLHPWHDEINPGVRIDTLSREELLEDIKKSTQVIKKLSGTRPNGWRTPHFGPQSHDDLFSCLKEDSYIYSSSSCDFYTDNGLPYLNEGIYELPISCCTDYPFVCFDDWSFRTSPNPIFESDGRFVKQWKRDILFAKSNNMFMNHYFDPYHLTNGKIIDEMCKFLRDNNIKTLTYSEFLGRLQSSNRIEKKN